MTQPEWKKLRCRSKKRKKSEGKMLYHCNLICVSPKHGMHGSLRCLKIAYIHNYWNLYFVRKLLWNSDDQKLLNFKIDFFYSNVISHFAVKQFYYHLVIIAQCKISVEFQWLQLRHFTSAIYGAPPFTGNRFITPFCSWKMWLVETYCKVWSFPSI